MKIVWFVFFILFASLSTSDAQRPALKVGNNPASIHNSAALELESTTKGFLPPRMTNAQMQAIPSPAQGLIVYCTDCNPMGLMENDGSPASPNWQNVGGGGGSSSSVVANCNTAGFNSATYTANTALNGIASFSVTITNNTFTTAVISFATTDLVLSGLSNMGNVAVSTFSGSPALVSNQATLTAGQSVTVTYQITGTPPSCGTLTGVWTKLSLTCTKSATVIPNVNCVAGQWTSAISPNPTTTNGLVNGSAYSGTYSIPYTGGSCAFNAETLTQDGLSLTISSSTLASSGNLVYTLSGTYSGTTGGSVTFTTARGCQIYVGFPRSCNDIITMNPLATSGVYTINPDGVLNSTFAAMSAQCDMTTDGGGWTMIMNYVRVANQTPSPVVRSTVPLISSGFGGSDVGNTAAFGHVSNALANAIPFREVRFEGQTTNHTRVMNAKSSTPSVISYIKTGIGNMSGSYSALPGNTTGTPGCSGESGTNAGNFALTAFTFFCENATQNWFRVYQFETNAYRMDSRSSNGVDNGVIDNTLHRAWVK